jgi:hypothetical protein
MVEKSKSYELDYSSTRYFEVEFGIGHITWDVTIEQPGSA